MNDPMVGCRMTGTLQSIAHLLKQVALVCNKDPDGVGVAEEGVEVVVAEQHPQLVWPQTLQGIYCDTDGAAWIT